MLEHDTLFQWSRMVAQVTNPPKSWILNAHCVLYSQPPTSSIVFYYAGCNYNRSRSTIIVMHQSAKRRRRRRTKVEPTFRRRRWIIDEDLSEKAPAPTKQDEKEKKIHRRKKPKNKKKKTPNCHRDEKDSAHLGRDAASVAVVGPRGPRSGRRQSGRETPLRRPAQQLQQAGPARGEHVGRAAGLHQAQAVPADRCGE